MRKSEGKAAADRGWLEMIQQSTIGTCLHICEESCGASAAPKDVAKAKHFHFSPHIGPSAAYAGLENRQDMARCGILGRRRTPELGPTHQPCQYGPREKQY